MLETLRSITFGKVRALVGTVPEAIEKAEDVVSDDAWIGNIIANQSKMMELVSETLSEISRL